MAKNVVGELGKLIVAKVQYIANLVTLQACGLVAEFFPRNKKLSLKMFLFWGRSYENKFLLKISMPWSQCHDFFSIG